MGVSGYVVEDLKEAVRAHGPYPLGEYAIVKASQPSELMDELEESEVRSRRLLSEGREVSAPSPETVNTGSGLPFFYIYLGRI